MKHAIFVSALLLAAGLAAPFAPAQEWTEEVILVESDHPYGNNLARAPYTIRRDGAEAIRVFFERVDLEKNWDFLDVEDGAGRRIQRLTGRAQNFWSETVESDRIVLRLTSDRSTAGFGFRVTRVAYELGEIAPAVVRIEAYLGGRPLGGEDVLALSPRGAPGSSADLEIRGFAPDGSQVSGFPFSPRIETLTGDELVTVQDLGGNRVRIVAGTTTARDVPVRLFGADRPDLETKFLVTIRRGTVPPPQVVTVASIGFLVPDGSGGKRLLARGETIELFVHEAGEDHLPFELAALDASGHAIPPDRANLGVQTNVTSFYGTLEQICHHQYVFHSGRLASEDVRITAYDRANSRTRATMRMRVVEPVEPGPVVSGIVFFVEDGRGGLRGVGSDEGFQLAVHEAGEDHLRFAVVAVDQDGDAIPPDATEFIVQANVTAWYGTIEQSCHHMYVFHSGSLPAPRVEIVAFERSNPEIRGVLRISTVQPRPCPRCGHIHGPHDPCHEEPQPEPEIHWVQIGETFASPQWAKPSQYMDGEFRPARDIQPLLQIRLIARNPMRVEEVRIEMEAGTQSITVQRTVPAGEELVLDVRADIRDSTLQRVWVRQRSQGGTEIRCYGHYGE